MAKGSVESFYPGLFSPREMPELTTSDLYIGYRFPTARIGAPLSAMSANQLAEAMKMLSSGMKTFEAGVLRPDVFEQIPKQHFKELNRLAKLTGTEPTWHLTVLRGDISGATENAISESARKEVENEFYSEIERVNEATGGGQPLTLHASLTLPKSVIKRPGEEAAIIHVVDVVNERIHRIETEEKFENGKIKYLSPEETIENINKETWGKTLGGFFFNLGEITKRIEEAQAHKAVVPHIKQALDSFVPLATDKEKFEQLTEEEKAYLFQKYPEAKGHYEELKERERIIRREEILFSTEVMQRAQEFLKTAMKAATKTEPEKVAQIKEAIKLYNEAEKYAQEDWRKALAMVEESMRILDKTRPKIYEFTENVGLQAASETLSNLALKSYLKFKDKAPIISVENPPAGGAFSDAESLRKLIEESRKKMVEKLKERGFSESKAREIAEKTIGVTWDVGHINMLRKYGYTPEQIKVELEKIKPFIKHVHLTDNFGFSDSHLPPGMAGIGEEIFKEIGELIKEKGLKAAVEAPTLAIAFGESPHYATLEAFGSPLAYLTYAMPTYFSGYGPILPEQHFSIYGAGFTTLPMEVGGQQPGKGGFAGVPME
jgi:tetratricopeptide (TPR) repeat protein